MPTILDWTGAESLLWALLPEIVLALGAMAVLLLDVFQRGSRQEASHPNVMFTAVAVLVLAALANAVLVRIGEASPDGVVAMDGFRVFTNFICLTAAALCLLLSSGYLDRFGINRGEFHALVLFATLGMMLMGGSRDLLLTFIALEVMSLSTYILVGFNRDDRRSSEASMKYFLLGSFSSAFFLYGIALIFGASGSTHLARVAQTAASPTHGGAMLNVGMALAAIGLAFKVAAVPFHVWTPDAYEGAPTPVTALMATGVKAAAFAAFIRTFAGALAGLRSEWIYAIAALAILTMVFANLIALTQGSVKRMLAYSSVAHAGYLLVALVAGNRVGASAFLFYLLAYTVMTVGSFAVVIAMGRGDREMITLEDYSGFGWERPWTAAAFALFLLSLAGFPLTAGFLGKLYILRAAVTAGHTPLAVILVLASLISYFYYLRLVIVMYMRPTTSPDQHREFRLAGPARFAVGLAAFATLALFFYPRHVLSAAERSAIGLFTDEAPRFGLQP